MSGLSDQRTLAVSADTAPRRRIALLFIACAQLMVALDATIVSVALPSAQTDLGISVADRQWVITAYTLAFGGLLLLGGRVADYAGRKRAFLLGLVGFAAASGAGGAAPDLATLAVMRALQGGFAALLAPAGLSLVTVMFTEPRERARAFGVYGMVAGSGGVAGLILGGVLTQHLGWRWCLYVNVPLALVTAVGSWFLITAVRPAHRPSLDVPGALSGTAGMVAVVYACGRALSDGWASPAVLGPLAAGAALLAVFAAVEARAAAPLVPPRILLDRARGGGYLAVTLAVAGMYGVFLVLTYFFQGVERYSPGRTGLAFLPLSLSLMAGSTLIAARLLPRVPPRVLIVPGLGAVVVALLLLTRLRVGTGYLTLVLPAEVVMGLGMGCVVVPVISTVTQGVAPRDSGAASAIVNAAQQVGASIGIAVLNTIAAGAAGGHDARATVHGYAVAALCGAGIVAVAALAAATLIRTPARTPREQQGQHGQ